MKPENYVIKENQDGTVITVKDIQKVLLKIMVEFDRICNKHNLDYVLAFGSQLGAVRHHGFIPWDDDIDIWMTRKAYLKLVEILKQELKSPFYFQCFEKEDKYNVTIPNMKIKIENTFLKEKNTIIKNRLDGEGLFIDIFILDSISENKYKHLFHRIVSTSIMPFIIIFDIMNIDSRFFTKLLYRYSNWYANKNKDSKYGYLSLSWTYDSFKDRRVLKSDVFPSIKWQFEDYSFRIANNYDKILKETYGDYMQLPKQASRQPKHIKEIIIDL
ncbi:MAG: LicD family protein [Erysipelothrix sp.]|nr:LicD family protein [Erysipelothrix sp.]